MKNHVTPWEVTGAVDYEKLIQEFGVQPIDEELLARLEVHAQKKGLELHPHLRRGIFFAHRDLKWLLDKYEAGEEFFLYTGRSPSGPIHLGHVMAWEFTKWLQEVFDCELWFQFPDEEKFLLKNDVSLQDTKHWLQENLLDVIAIGFDPKKTHFLIDTQHANLLYPQAIRVAKKITYNQVKNTFGFSDSQNIGAIFYTAMQAVPAFLPSVIAGKNIPCLIPYAIDQDPHFRISREVIKKLGYYKPASIQCRFLPSLKGLDADGKMSSSQQNAAVLMTDTEAQVKKKINKYARSGGQETLEEHRKKGGDPAVDVAYQWLRFLEPSDEKLQELHDRYVSGELLSGEMKQACIHAVNTYLAPHQLRREQAANKVDQFILRY